MSMIDAQLPRYGKKTYPWIGTTGAGQNCPERESESPGEDIIIEDSVLVLGSNSLFYFFGFKSDSRSLSPTIAGASLIRTKIFKVYIYTSPLNWNRLSVSQDIHSFVACLSVSPRKIMFCQTVLSVKKGKQQGNKQSLNLRPAPCRRHGCAVH